jgi:hypothetical protein
VKSSRLERYVSSRDLVNLCGRALATGRPIREQYLIVHEGKLAGAGAHSYSAGNATRAAGAKSWG